MLNQIKSALNWRYATKLFNPKATLTEEQLNALLEAARLAPSSLGLQPYKLYVIKSPEVRNSLRNAAWNQPQITDASHLVVFAARKTLDENYVNSFLAEVMAARGQTAEQLAGYKQMLMGSFANKSPEQVLAWNARQAYIALGFLNETAALLNIDACPMEGFDAAQFDTILKLDKTNYTALVVAAVGFRDESDSYATAPKARFAKKILVEEV